MMEISRNIEVDNDYREYRRLWELAGARKIVTDVPLHLDIELTNACNLKCAMCWQANYLSYPKGFMSLDLYKKVIDEGVRKGVRAIKLQSRGEAMLHPDIVEAIRYAKKKGIIDVHLTTNATLLRRDVWKDYLESGLDILNLSIDRSHRDSFDELYGGGAYEAVIDNMIGFLKLRKELGKEKPYVKLQVVRFGDDVDPYVKEKADMMRGLVDKIVVDPVFKLFDDKAKTNDEMISAPCSYLWQRMVINYDGKVTMCCRDYNCVRIMGDINNQTLEEVWSGTAYKNTRAAHTGMRRDMIDICATCKVC